MGCFFNTFLCFTFTCFMQYLFVNQCSGSYRPVQSRNENLFRLHTFSSTIMIVNNTYLVFVLDLDVLINCYMISICLYLYYHT